MEKGLLLLGAGPKVLRFVPPLVVSEMERNQAMGILKGALMEWSA